MPKGFGVRLCSAAFSSLFIVWVTGSFIHTPRLAYGTSICLKFCLFFVTLRISRRISRLLSHCHFKIFTSQGGILVFSIHRQASCFIEAAAKTRHLSLP